MGLQRSFCAILLSAAATASGAPLDRIGVRILFGMRDRQSTKWDGSLNAKDAQVISIEPWRIGDFVTLQKFELNNTITGNSWKISTHESRLFKVRGPEFEGTAMGPVDANGVIVQLRNTAPNAELSIHTAQGDFSVRIADLPYGKVVHELDGRVRIDAVPPATRITNDPQEQDYPAAAVKDGTVWLAYTEFIHNPDHDNLRVPLKEAPRDFSAYTAPTGGDHILARAFRNNHWSAPIEISARGGDVYRPAIAIDRSGRPWVFWSQNQGGNFDIWASPIENDKGGKPIRITSEAGTDMDPVAATDAKGNVWVAWQAWRNGHATILFSRQNGVAFSTGKAVAPASGNQWNPAIAADASGDVAVAWDTYRNGNYDVIMRTAKNGVWAQVTPVAASARYEAYPSIAYDPEGRLWVAYEEGGARWGKDFGVAETTGLALYEGRAIRLRGFAPDGRPVRTRTDPGDRMEGPSSNQIDNGHQNDSDAWLRPDPERIKMRKASNELPDVVAPRNTSPRMTIDASGRIWLAYRINSPLTLTQLGAIWTESLVSYDGSQWTGPIYLTHSDNFLDNRPAVISNAPGQVMIVGSSDNRSEFQLTPDSVMPTSVNGRYPLVHDPHQNDLFANLITLGPAHAKIETDPAPQSTESTTPLAPADQVERAAIAKMRAYRLHYQNQTLRVAHGEFHRHSEYSFDGNVDGSILDQWRYAIDAADLDWIGCCDHDNGGGREYTWWLTQKETDLFYAPGRFAPIFSYERSVAYPEGHRNVLFAQRGVRTLPRLPKVANDSAGNAPDTQMLYGYLRQFNGLVAAHTSATNQGTDWRDHDPEVETSVEIYQGTRQSYEEPGAPRSNSEKDSISGFQAKGYVDLALQKGFQLAFEASSDHVSTHMSFANVLTTDLTRAALLDGFRKRHLYASTDNILAEFRSGDHIMGDAFSTSSIPVFHVKLAGTAPFAKVFVIKDNAYVYSATPNQADVEFTWQDAHPESGKTSYYYVRGEQADGELVWVTPMWITYTPK